MRETEVRIDLEHGKELLSDSVDVKSPLKRNMMSVQVREGRRGKGDDDESTFRHSSWGAKAMSQQPSLSK